jgi:hypothetical protein
MITLPRKPWLVYPRLGEIEGLIRGGKTTPQSHYSFYSALKMDDLGLLNAFSLLNAWTNLCIGACCLPGSEDHGFLGVLQGYQRFSHGHHLTGARYDFGGETFPRRSYWRWSACSIQEGFSRLLRSELLYKFYSFVTCLRSTSEFSRVPRSKFLYKFGVFNTCLCSTLEIHIKDGRSEWTS